MLQLAKEFGHLESMFPKGCTKMYKCSWSILLAIKYAAMILNWHEHLPEKKIPPRHMWTDEDELEKWFLRWKKDEERGKDRTTYDYYVEVPQT